MSGWNDATRITLALFFGRSWFRRVWCLQEVLLSKNAEEAVVLYGNILLNWEQIVMASLWLTTSGLVQRLIIPKLEGLSDLTVRSFPKTNVAYTGHNPSQSAFISLLLAGAELDLPHLEHWAGQPLTHLNASSVLCLIIVASRNFEATDPRDKIFGILGIVEQIARVWNFQPSRLIADYTKPTWKVFLEAAQDIYEGTGNLTILSLALDDSQLKIPHLPSWVPNFSAAGINSLVSRNNRPTGYDAAGGSTPKFRIDAKSITLQAFTVGTVAELGERCEDMIQYGRLKASLRTVLNCPSLYRTGENRIQAFWRTLVGDKEGLSSEYYPAGIDLGNAFGEWLKSTLAYRNLIEACAPEICVIPTEYDEILEMIDELAITDTTAVMPDASAVYDLIQKCEGLEHTAESIINQLGRHCPCQKWAAAFMDIAPGRRMFRTSEGCLGLGPESVQVGDTLWVISGVMTPFIFRSASLDNREPYKVVGETYLHGIMNGEEVKNNTWREVCLI